MLSGGSIQDLAGTTPWSRGQTPAPSTGQRWGAGVALSQEPVWPKDRPPSNLEGVLPDAKTPHCGACNHAISFHRNGVTRCYVSGCSCPFWDGPTMVEIKTLSITEAAEVTGRSTDWLRKHWREVGGRRVEADLLGRTGPTELRFKLPQLNRGIARYERKSAANWHKGAKKAWRTKRAKARQTRKGK